MVKRIILVFVLLWMCGFSPSSALAAEGTTLIAYNSIAGILGGNIWEYTTQEVLLQRLSAFPPCYSIFLMGTTLENFRIGELAGFGTVARPEFYWCNPEYPYDSRPLAHQKLGLGVMLICDPEDRIDLEIPPGVNLHQEIARQLKERRADFAVISVQGSFKELIYTLAFNIDKKGINLKDTSTFTAAYKETERFDWRLEGVLAADPKIEPLLTYGGVPVHLHGIQVGGKIGGHISKAITDQVTVSAYPIGRAEFNQTDLSLEVIVANNDRILLKANNWGMTFCDHGKVTATLPDGKVALSTRLATLGPGSTQFIDLKPTMDIQGKSVTFSIDPQNEIVESNEGNNSTVMSIP